MLLHVFEISERRVRLVMRLLRRNKHHIMKQMRLLVTLLFSAIEQRLRDHHSLLLIPFLHPLMVRLVFLSRASPTTAATVVIVSGRFTE